MKTSRYVYLVSVVFLVMGCSVPIKPDPIRLPLSIAPQNEYAGSQATRSPAIPKVGGEPKEWKYGYYCGENYPPAPAKPMSREALVATYYQTEPYDDIDKACRDHDVCWIYFGDSDGQCNEQLYENIYYINKAFMYWDGSPRCQSVTGDITAAFISIFVPDRYQNKAIEAGQKAGKITSLLLLLPGAFIQMSLNHVNGYPSEGEKCNVAPLKE